MYFNSQNRHSSVVFGGGGVGGERKESNIRQKLGLINLVTNRLSKSGHIKQALVVQRLDNAIQRINRNPVDKC